MKKIVVQYQEEHFPRSIRMKIIEVPDDLNTWRQLQQHFDPGYHYDNLKFWNLGSGILGSEVIPS